MKSVNLAPLKQLESAASGAARPIQSVNIYPELERHIHLLEVVLLCAWFLTHMHIANET